jgi:hypothetical protein
VYGSPDQTAQQTSSASGQAPSDTNVATHTGSAAATGNAVAEALISSGVPQGLDTLFQTQQNSVSSLTTALGHEEPRTQSGVRDIAIQGSQGTYTLQIQPAGGIGGTGSADDIPHEEVLSNGLLRDILAAIEQPSRQTPYFDSSDDLHHASAGSLVAYQPPPELEGQGSASKEVSVKPLSENEPEANSIVNSTQEPERHDESRSLPFSFKNNKVALYFRPQDNNQSTLADTAPSNSTVGESDSPVDDGHRDSVIGENTEKSGSFVAFSDAHSNYVYGDLPTAFEAGFNSSIPIISETPTSKSAT